MLFQTRLKKIYISIESGKKQEVKQKSLYSVAIITELWFPDVRGSVLD